MLHTKKIKTPSLTQHIITNDVSSDEVVLFIHGNASSSVFWEEQMEMLPPNYRSIAVDLRGYGETEPVVHDATQGCLQWATDILELMDELKVEKCHVVGHSMGGSAVYNLLTIASDRIVSATLVAPASPFGFGGTKDEIGTPCYSDFAGSGGGTVNAGFARRMKEGDTSEEDPNASPRVVMNSFYWKPPFRPAREEKLLLSMISERVGEDAYPGDFVASENWPNVAPGIYGPVNASSPKYAIPAAEKLMKSGIQTPILWVRGSDDQIVSDNSFFEMGTLGKLGLIPGYPGEEVYPSQPMIAQTRYVLEKLKEGGATYKEVVIEETGHTPYIEKPSEFAAVFHTHLKETA
ncbi:MAG: alpha/beta hydrolase [Bacteroidetes bacterium]|nr:MAG: alpha/beta hydrolase [Bacteroidota bacterium]